MDDFTYYLGVNIYYVQVRPHTGESRDFLCGRLKISMRADATMEANIPVSRVEHGFRWWRGFVCYCGNGRIGF